MIRFLLILFLGLSISCPFTLAQKDISLWATVPVVIDGHGSEWPEFARFRNTQTGLPYDIRNDQDNLYLLLRVPDVLLQMRLMHAGMKVSLKVKSSTWSFIIFPAMSLGNTDDEDLTLNIQATAARYMKILSQETVMEGFASTGKSAESGNEKYSSISFAIGWNEEGVMIYEIGIPLKELYGEKYIFSQISGSAINLRAESNAFAGSAFINEEEQDSESHAMRSLHNADQVSGPRLECKFTLAEHK